MVVDIDAVQTRIERIVKTTIHLGHSVDVFLAFKILHNELEDLERKVGQSSFRHDGTISQTSWNEVMGGNFGRRSRTNENRRNWTSQVGWQDVTR